MEKNKGRFVNGNIDKDKGITLIALVITIIVLLILAGISISTLLESGILNQASRAVTNTKIAEIDEQAQIITGVSVASQYQGKNFRESVEEGLKSYQNFNQTAEFSEDGKIAIITETETGRQYEIISIKDEKGEEIVELERKPLTEVKAGDYINYYIGNGNGTNNGEYIVASSETGYTGNQKYNVKNYTGSWRIIYNDETYGIQIISNENILEYDSSSKLNLYGIKGYNNLVSILNKVSEYYINPDYATDARSVGTDPLNKAGETEYYTSQYGYVETSPINPIKPEKTYLTDLNAMTKVGTAGIYKTYWYASRTIIENSSLTKFVALNATTSGGASTSYYIASLGSGGAVTYNTYGYGVRPVITLKSDLIVEDTGTEMSGKKVWNIVEQ